MGIEVVGVVWSNDGSTLYFLQDDTEGRDSVAKQRKRPSRLSGPLLGVLMVGVLLLVGGSALKWDGVSFAGGCLTGLILLILGLLRFSRQKSKHSRRRRKKG